MTRTVQFTALDALRGLAAIAVTLFHFFPSWAGYLAVDFFFLLSGFILAHGYLYGPTHVGWRVFLIHRLARLYPLHLFALMVFLVCSVALGHAWPTYPDGTGFTLVQQVLLLNNVGLNPHGLTYNEPSWSISTEFVVNMLFIAFITTRTRSSVMVLVAMLGFGLIWALSGHLDVHFENYFGVLNAGLIRCLSSFLLGVLTYRVYLRCRELGCMQNVWPWLELVAISLVLVLVFGRAGKVSQIDFAMPLLFMLVVVVFALERGWLSRHLGRLAYFGKISFSIYLNQFSVLMLIRHLWGEHGVPLQLAAYLLILWVCSHFTYTWIEQPARIYMRNRLERFA